MSPVLAQWWAALSRPPWCWLLVVAAAVVPYANSLDNGFHFDDEHSLLRNPHLRQPASIPQFFVDSGTFSGEPAMAMYRPLLQTTFALNYALGGYEPAGWHGVNVLLHALAAAGAYALFRRLLGGSAALVAALLFALHPAHTQSVNYISSRSEVMCMAGVLWALYLTQVGRSGWASLAYAGALLTKSAAVALLPLLTLLTWRQPSQRRRWQPLYGLGAVTVAYVLLIRAEGFLGRSLAQDVRSLPEQLWTQTKALTYYLHLATFPHRLSVEHDFSLSSTPWQGPVLLALALILSLVGLSLAYRHQVVAAGAGWFVVALGLPFVVPLNVLINEHRMYLPLAGAALAVAVPLGEVRWRASSSGLALVLGALLFSILTWNRNQVWQNDLTLWTSAAERAGHSHRAWSNLGLAQHADGRLQEAGSSYERALALNPRNQRAWNNLGLLREETGDLPGAVGAYERSAGLSKTFSGGLANLGRVHLQRGKLEAAAVALQAALARNRNDVDAVIHTGRLAQLRGDPSTARQRYEEALRLDPSSAPAANNLGMVLVEEGHLEEGRRWLQWAVSRDGGYEEAEINLALLDLESAGVAPAAAYRQLVARFPAHGRLVVALGRLHARGGSWEEAIEVYRSALERGVTTPGLRAALGSAYQALGQDQSALLEYRIAVREDPADARLWNNLAAAAAASGRLPEALDAAQRALRLDPADERARTNVERLQQAGAGAAEDRSESR